MTNVISSVLAFCVAFLDRPDRFSILLVGSDESLCWRLVDRESGHSLTYSFGTIGFGAAETAWGSYSERFITSSDAAPYHALIGSVDWVGSLAKLLDNCEDSMWFDYDGTNKIRCIKALRATAKESGHYLSLLAAKNLVEAWTIGYAAND